MNTVNSDDNSAENNVPIVKNKTLSHPYMTYGRMLLWGAWPERQYLRLRHKLNPDLDFALRRGERTGFCSSFGVIPVHSTILVVMPWLAAAAMQEITGLPAAVRSFLYCLQSLHQSALSFVLSHKL